MDATIGAEYWSSRRWAQHGQFRAMPNDKTSILASYFGVIDRGIGHTGPNLGGQDLKVNAGTLFSHDIRGVASIEYLSSYLLRLGFAETFAQAINSEVKSAGFLTKNYDGFSFNAEADRYQNFQ